MAKKFYWLKLKDNFFNQREIKKLRKIAGGDTFVIIYLKMQLLSVKTEGKIEFEGTEENMLDQLELELDEDRDNISLTIGYLAKNKLLEIIDNDYLLPQACENIGKESDSAERVRKHRERKLLQNNTITLQSNNCNATSNTEIEIEKEIEKRKKINKNIYNENVHLSEDEYNKLIERFGKENTEDKIENLSLYLKSKGKRYKCHYSTILAWDRKENKDKPKQEIKYDTVTQEELDLLPYK